MEKKSKEFQENKWYVTHKPLLKGGALIALGIAFFFVGITVGHPLFKIPAFGFPSFGLCVIKKHLTDLSRHNSAAQINHDMTPQ